jgi:nucleoside-diphosphate-sugar epimerase
MRVFVLGGTGSIGAAVIEALLSRGHQVLALTRSASAAARVNAVGAQAWRASQFLQRIGHRFRRGRCHRQSDGAARRAGATAMDSSRR